MAVFYKTQGFVFKKEDRQDSDRFFSIFTKDFGRVEVVGKSIRKTLSKLRGGIEIFSFSDVEFIQGKSRKTLTEAAFLQKLRGIAESPAKLNVAQRIGHTLDRFIRGQEADEEIWALLSDVFLKLDGVPALRTNVLRCYYYFFWNFIAVLGYAPEVSVCVNCRQALNPTQIYFSYKDGGVLCQDCGSRNKDAIKVEPDAIKIIRLILQKEWETVLKLTSSSEARKSLREISKGYYHYLLPIIKYVS